MDRRSFGKLAIGGAIGALASSVRLAGNVDADSAEDRLSVHIFSKHLQFLDYRDMAEAAAEIGFDGIDLTVRPGGHVLPERAEEDLPSAAEAIRSVGFEPNMLVSRITSVSDKVGIQSLRTASELGFKRYRMGYYRPDESKDLEQNLNHCAGELKELAAFNQEVGLHGAYQNHAGRVIGSYVTDLALLLKGHDPRWLGCQYDIRHATVDGGSSWPLGLRYLAKHIRTMPIKDFSWFKENGKWVVRNVLLGEGMVDFDRFFKALRGYRLKPYVSLHLEYDLGGAEHGDREIKISQKAVFSAMRRDLKRLHEMWEWSAD